MSFEIRLATLDDVEALVELAARTFPLACPASMPAEAIEEFIAEELNADVFTDWIRGDHVNVAARGGKIVGYATVLDEPHPDYPNSKYLTKFYVDPAEHGQGIAPQLFAALEDADPGVGFWLGTNEANERAQGFYAKVGFERIGARSFKVGEATGSDYIFYRPPAASRTTSTV